MLSAKEARDLFYRDPMEAGTLVRLGDFSAMVRCRHTGRLAGPFPSVQHAHEYKRGVFNAMSDNTWDDRYELILLPPARAMLEKMKAGELTN